MSKERFVLKALQWPGMAVRAVLIAWIRFYQRYISFLIGPACRFHPSCSNYAIEALRKKKIHVALILIFWRILRCQPLCKGGFDPVPTADNPAEINQEGEIHQSATEITEK